MQHDPALIERMTFLSPTSGERVGLSFIEPRSVEDLIRRRDMVKIWADATCGMFGRSPDYMNIFITAFASAAEEFGKKDKSFAENIRGYHGYIREERHLYDPYFDQPAGRPLAARRETGQGSRSEDRQGDRRRDRHPRRAHGVHPVRLFGRPSRAAVDLHRQQQGSRAIRFRLHRGGQCTRSALHLPPLGGSSERRLADGLSALRAVRRDRRYGCL
jgi:hypothetical protein